MSGFELIILPDEVDIEAAEILVDGSLESHEYRFLLDTGAARSSVQHDGYTSTFPIVSQSESSGVFASGSYDLITIPHIRLGPITRSDFTLVRVRENAQDRRNLIGMDLLKDVRLHFLFGENRVLVDPEDAPAAVHLLDLFLDAAFHPYVSVQFGEERANAVWDTGAGITVVDSNFIQRFPALFQEVGQSKGTDSTGTEMQTTMFTMAASIIGGYAFSSQKVAGVDLSRANATIERPMDMILGYSAMRQANWIFDFPRRKWGISGLLG